VSCRNFDEKIFSECVKLYKNARRLIAVYKVETTTGKIEEREQAEKSVREPVGGERERRERL